MLGMTNVAIQMALLLKSLFSRDRLASASSLGTLPTRDLLLCSRLLFCFVLFLNLGCISVEYHFVVHLYRRNLFLSFSIASSKVEILFSCSLFLHEDLFFLYSLTNLSALAFFIRFSIWSNLGIDNDISYIKQCLRVNEIWYYFPNSFGIEPCPTQATCIICCRTGAIWNPLWEILEQMSLWQQFQNLTLPCYLFQF